MKNHEEFSGQPVTSPIMSLYCNQHYSGIVTTEKGISERHPARQFI
jgi:hypothetical protein